MGQQSHYNYALDRPGGVSDPLGLYEVVGFPPGPAAAVNRAMARVHHTVKRRPCCASDTYADVEAWLEDPDLIIKYDSTIKECAHVNFLGHVFGLRPVITVVPAAFTGACFYGGSPSDALASTLFHELGHFEGGRHDAIEPEEASCFGCLPAP